MRAFRPLPLLSSFLLLAWAVPAQAFWPFDEKGIEYKVQLDGAEDDLAKWLRSVSRLENDPKPPPKDAIELESLAAADVNRLRDGLKARGYYDAEVQMRVLSDPKGKDGKPLIVQYALQPGPQYHLVASRIDWQGDYHYPVENLADLAPKAGTPAEAELLQLTTQKLKRQMGNQFCLLTLDIVPAVDLDHKQHLAQPVFQIKAGPPALVGPLKVSGEKRATESLVRRQTKLKEGDCYSQDKVESGRNALLSSQLYGQADIKPLTELPGPDKKVPMQVDVTERQARTIRFGLSYDTDIGPGGTIKWEHRNIDGDALKGNVDFTMSQRLQGIDAKAYRPDFWMEKQTLTTNAQIQHENTDAYDANTTAIGANVERPLWNHLTGGVGGGYRLSQVKRTDQEETFGLVFTPGFLQYDDRDDSTNATKGIYSRLSLTPYFDTLGTGVNFFKSQFTMQTYLTAEQWPLTPTLALRGVVGVIDGAAPENVPADLRFYSGGGGSVRGYAYQSIGPRTNGDPTGGNSWTEFSAELRVKFTESLGAVAFLDGGAVQPDAWSGLGQDLLMGAGGGLRYYTPVGPLRFDVAVPLDKRPEIDSAYQLYVSLGQAF